MCLPQLFHVVCRDSGALVYRHLDDTQLVLQWLIAAVLEAVISMGQFAVNQIMTRTHFPLAYGIKNLKFLLLLVVLLLKLNSRMCGIDISRDVPKECVHEDHYSVKSTALLE